MKVIQVQGLEKSPTKATRLREKAQFKTFCGQHSAILMCAIVVGHRICMSFALKPCPDILMRNCLLGSGKWTSQIGKAEMRICTLQSKPESGAQHTIKTNIRDVRLTHWISFPKTHNCIFLGINLFFNISQWQNSINRIHKIFATFYIRH